MTVQNTEATTQRRIFPTWSIAVPDDFDETFVEEDNYWHAFTDDRSISMTSMQISDGRRPVPGAEIMREMSRLFDDGDPVESGPADLLWSAVFADAPDTSRARRLLSGVVASDGRALLVTITSDDLEWAERTWRSIRRTGALPGDLAHATRQHGRPKPPRRPTSSGRHNRGR